MGNPGQLGIKGVFRDHCDTKLRAFSKPVGESMATEGKIEAILEGYHKPNLCDFQTEALVFPFHGGPTEKEVHEDMMRDPKKKKKTQKHGCCKQFEMSFFLDSICC